MSTYCVPSPHLSVPAVAQSGKGCDPGEGLGRCPSVRNLQGRIQTWVPLTSEHRTIPLSPAGGPGLGFFPGSLASPTARRQQ